MPPAKWKCSEPGCGVSAKNEAGLIEHYEVCAVFCLVLWISHLECAWDVEAGEHSLLP